MPRYSWILASGALNPRTHKYHCISPQVDWSPSLNNVCDVSRCFETSVGRWWHMMLEADKSSVLQLDAIFRRFFPPSAGYLWTALCQWPRLAKGFDNTPAQNRTNSSKRVPDPDYSIDQCLTAGAKATLQCFSEKYLLAMTFDIWSSPWVQHSDCGCPWGAV